MCQREDGVMIRFGYLWRTLLTADLGYPLSQIRFEHLGRGGGNSSVGPPVGPVRLGTIQQRNLLGCCLELAKTSPDGGLES
jgi:hypothetical protein